MADLFVVTLVLVGFLVMLALHASQQRQLDKVNKQLCAWIIWEDGSASPRTDDFDRFKCREERG